MGVGIKSTKIKYEIIVELSALAKKVDNQLNIFQLWNIQSEGDVLLKYPVID